LHAWICERQVDGAPAHDPAQQSEDVAQLAPSKTQSATQTSGPWFTVCAQLPRQQSAVVRHGAPIARQAPGPTSHRPS
jgi:hypothetical protein